MTLIESHHAFMWHMRRLGWVDHDDQLVHPRVPNLQYAVYQYWGVIEQVRQRSGWWSARGWSWGRFYLTSHGTFERMPDATY